MKARQYKLTRNFSELGAYLKQCREKAGLTQRQVSLELGYSSAQFISNFERGISAPPLKRLRELVKFSKLSVTKVTELYLEGVKVEILQGLHQRKIPGGEDAKTNVTRGRNIARGLRAKNRSGISDGGVLVTQQ